MSHDHKKTNQPVDILTERQRMWKSFTKFSLYTTIVVVVILGLMRLFLVH